MEQRQPTSLDVARFFLSIAQAEEAGDTISNLKMQKLVYYAQGYHLAETGKRLFDEEIQAWKYGPVAPQLYAKLNKFGNGAIDLGELGNNEPDVFTEEQRNMLIEVYDEYGAYSAFVLRDMTHAEIPWRKATNDGKYIDFFHPMSDDLIRDFFTQMLAEKYKGLLEQSEGEQAYTFEEMEQRLNAC